MSFWSLYFLATIVLHHLGYLKVQLGWNVLLAVYVYWPIKSKNLRRLRLIIGSLAALFLLWCESQLPHPVYAFQQLKLLSGFSLEYLLELAARMVNYYILLAILICVIVYIVLGRRVRFASFVWLGFLSILLWHNDPEPQNFAAQRANTEHTEHDETLLVEPTSISASNTQLENFFDKERLKHLSFNNSSVKNFDVILLHVCSLSWDDLAFIQLSDHHFISKANIIFKQFNTATSYSGPASLRVLHGNCGQQKHSDLYSSSDASCFVFPSLETAGFQTHALLNHDGKFDNFGKELEDRGGLRGKLELPSGPGATLRSFDNSLIYGDYDVLSKWHAENIKPNSKPSALYYNSITMHDGVRSISSTDRDSLNTYLPRANKMLDDFEHFKQNVEASGRPTIMVLVPEHGANLRGDAMQIAGLREIPSPNITLGPALVYVINAPSIPKYPVVVNEMMSYFDLYTLLDDMLTNSPFTASTTPLSSRIQKLAGTQFVSESASATIMQTNDQRFWVRPSGSNTWVQYNN